MRRALAGLGLLIACAAPALASAQQHTQIFREANEAYFRGRYEDAIRGYAQLVEAGFEDPDVTFNLATSYARLRRYGHAIRWFERTLELRPGDEGAEQGLAAARGALGRRRAEAQGEATVATRPPLGEALVGPFSESFLALVVLLLDLIFFGLLISFRWVRREEARLAMGIAAPIVGVLLVASVAGLAVKSGALEEGRPAIVLRENAPVREGPSQEAQPRMQALEGDRIRVLTRDGHWYRVRLSQDREGWMHTADVGTI